MSAAGRDQIEIGKHRVYHLPRLKVRADFFEKVFGPGCSAANCNARCCRGGVYVDLREKEEILSNAELIQSFMDPDQVKDPGRWFEGRVVDDLDYPSGACVGTQVHGGACVFLTNEGKCVLQVASTQAGKGKGAWKPYYCQIYPVTVENGELKLEDPEYADRPECCGCTAGPGALTVFEACPEEMEMVLGREGVEEMRRLMK